MKEEHKENVALISDSKAEDELADNEIYYQNYSSYLLRSKKKIGNIKKRTDGVILSVENIVFKREELYFVLKIDNRSSIDYDLILLEVSSQAAHFQLALRLTVLAKVSLATGYLRFLFILRSEI